MTIDLYQMPVSGPCRTIILVAKTIGVDLNLKECNLMTGDQLKPEFIKLNPQHTIPTLVDDGFCMGESRAICTYLINKYAPGHSLYPTCAKKRATIDRYLYFDIGTLYKAISEYYYPKLMHGKELDPEKGQKLKEVLGFLEAFLGDQNYLTGKEPSLADIAIGTSLSMLEVSGVGFPDNPKLEAYYGRMKKFPLWEETHAKGIAAFKQWLASKNQ